MNENKELTEIRDLINQIKEAKKKGIRWSSKTIKAETRQLRATWTTEMAYDIAKFSSIDAEEELKALLLKELGNDRDSI